MTPVRSATATMRASLVAGPRSLATVTVPRPEPGPGEVLVRLEGCGVCGSNLPVWLGRSGSEYPLPAGMPGHEGWGTVEETGDGVEGLRPGDRVAALSYHAFAEYDLAPASDLVLLPESLEYEVFPGEPLACAVNVFRRSGIEAGHSVAVVGVGFLGALIVQLASSAGARVTAFSRRLFARDVALACGAAEAQGLDGAGGEFDVVVEAVGEQVALDLATRLLGVRGRLVVAGFHQGGPRQVDMQRWNWNGLDVINAHERDPRVYLEGMRLAVDLVAEGRIDLSDLITHRLPLDRLDQALDLAEARPDGFLKAVVRT